MLTFVSGFTLLFMLMNPVPRLIKFVFHVFGVICFIEGLVHIGLTSQAAECVSLFQEVFYPLALEGALIDTFFCTCIVHTYIPTLVSVLIL